MGNWKSCGQRVFLTWMGRVLGTLKILTISKMNHKGDFHWNHYPTTPWCGQSLGAQLQDEWLPLTHFRLQEFFHGMGWFDFGVARSFFMPGWESTELWWEIQAKKTSPPQCQVPAVPAPKNQSNRGIIKKPWLRPLGLACVFLLDPLLFTSVRILPFHPLEITSMNPKKRPLLYKTHCDLKRSTTE